MNNFVFYSPTEFVFGKNTEVQVGALARKYGAQKVMIVYGGGSVVRNIRLFPLQWRFMTLQRQTLWTNV